MVLIFLDVLARMGVTCDDVASSMSFGSQYDSARESMLSSDPSDMLLRT